MGEFFRRLRYLINSGRHDRELADEMEFHHEMATRQDSGIPLGSPLRLREQSRDAWGWIWLEDLLQDIRFSLRMLRRSPGFSILAILCLTLGIGATTTVFSWIEGILLRPFPAVSGQDRMVAIGGINHGVFDDVSWPDFQDMQRHCTLFDYFIVDKITGTTLAVGDRAERATGSVVSANYFDALGVRPLLGRGFQPQDDFGRNAHPVTVISYRMWKDRLGGDPNVVGRTQMLNGMPHTIIGVAPEGFLGTFVGWGMQFWVPTSMQERFISPGYKLEDRGERWIEGFARLKPGVTIPQAQAEISTLAHRLETEYPATNRGLDFRLYALWQTPFNNANTLLPTLSVALTVVVFVLFIACANVSNLLLVRAFGRRHEMTVRLAVGAGRRRLLKQLLTEGIILATFAAAGGIVISIWSRNALPLLFPPRGGLTMTLPGQIDWRVLALSAGVCVISTLLFGLVPALQTSKVDLAGAMRSESSGTIGGRGRALARSVLVVVQVTLTFVLLVGAGLLLQSLRGLQNINPGFTTNGVLTTSIDFVSAGYDAPHARIIQDELINRIQALGGVESLAFARITPFSVRSYSSAPITVDGYQPARDELPVVYYDEVGPAFLSTMGIPLVAGREFTRADDETAMQVAVVNEAMAAKYWGGRDPVGQRLQVKGAWRQVVGLAKTAKYGNLTETTKPFFYVPLRQSLLGQGLQIRTHLSTAEMTSALVREIHTLDSNLAPGEVITMQEQVDRTTAAQKIAVMMLCVFGGLAMLLAAVGLYGVMSYTVSQSTREMGLRLALGANPSDLVRLVMSHGLTLTGGGILLGIAVALGTTRLMGNLLYKVSARDPLAFAAAFVVLALASLAASFLPAWRATRTDPVRALRDA